VRLFEEILVSEERGYSMRPLVSVFLCFVMLAGLLVYAPSRAEALPNDSLIAGTVTDGVDPIEGAYVKVLMMMAEGIEVNSSFSDATGYYEIGVPGGFDYMVFAVHEDHYFVMEMASVGSSETVTVDITMTAIVEPKDVTIMGYVLDEFGSPVTDGTVLAMTHDLTGKTTMPVFCNFTQPDGTGYFELTVIASPYGGGSIIMDIPGFNMISNESNDPIESGMAYWFNLTLAAPSYSDDCRVSGTVTDGYGTPLEFVLVSIGTWNEYSMGSYSNYTFTDAAGHYDLNFTNGSGEITFGKSGYTNYMERFAADAGADMTLNVALYQVTGEMHGNVTDLSTGLGIPDARVMQMYSVWYSESSGWARYTVGYANSSGYYEMPTWPADGPSSAVAAEADGYSNNWTQMDVSGSGVLWMDFGLWPVNSLLEGYVTDYVTGDPIEYAWVWAQSDTYSQGTETDATGYYSIPLPFGEYTVNVNAMDYRNEQATIDVPDGTTVALDFELLPWNLPDTTRLYGWVNTTGTLYPVADAEIRVALETDLNDQNSTMSNETGYYEIMVPSVPLAYRATALNHGLTAGTVDATGLPEIRLDILLDWDEWSPNVTYSQTPTENITWINPSIISVEVEEQNLQSLALYQCMYLDTVGGWDQFSVIGGASMSFDPWDAGGDLSYSLVGDVYTVDTFWNATATAGWLANTTDQAYLWAFEVLMYGTDPYYVLRGFYSNSTLTVPQSGSAFFDQSTGAFAMFMFDDQWSFGVAYPDDTTGILSPSISRIDVNQTDPMFWMGYGGAPLGDWSVADIVFTYDEVAPSGVYKTLFIATDFGQHWSVTLTNMTVDNEVPVAYAGIDQTPVVNTTVTLDAGGSSDNVGIVSYTWEYEDSLGSTVPLDGVTADVVFDVVGDYLVTLTVVDGAGHSATDTVLISVSADEIPVADAGPDQSVDEDTAVSFDGAGSSDDLIIIVNYTWTIVELDVEMYEVAPEYTFDEPGTYHVELVVEDTIGQASLVDEMVVTVADVTDPTADAGADQEVDMGTEVTFDGTGSDDNVAVVSWEWTFGDDGAQSLPDETATYTFENAGVFTVTLTVEDAALNSDTDTVVITVIDTEAPFADAGEDVSVVVGGTVTLNGTGSSDNVGIASYTWTFTDVTGQVLIGVEQEYTFENEGDFTITLTVVDAEGGSDTDEVVVHVLPENSAPTADAGDDQPVTEGDTVTLDGTGSTDDGGAEALNYTWTFEYDGETVTRYGAEVEFTFDIPGEYDVTLTVEDEDGLTSSDSVTITVEEKSATFIEQYWWALAALAAVIVVAAAIMLFMKKGKGGAPSKKAPKKDEDADDEMEDEDEPPAPPEEEEL
jgi:PKD repeat protein